MNKKKILIPIITLVTSAIAGKLIYDKVYDTPEHNSERLLKSLTNTLEKFKTFRNEILSIISDVNEEDIKQILTDDFTLDLIKNVSKIKIPNIKSNINSELIEDFYDIYEELSEIKTLFIAKLASKDYEFFKNEDVFNKVERLFDQINNKFQEVEVSVVLDDKSEEQDENNSKVDTEELLQ